MPITMNYQTFLKTKEITLKKSGFDPGELNSNLFPFQKHIVRKALQNGKYAIFAECGLGKTLMQLSFASEVAKYTGGNCLILAPLAVSSQTISEGRKFGIKVEKYSDGKSGILITNYEQVSNLPESFIDSLQCIVLDESSILKNFTGKTKRLLIETFKDTPYKLACTATPSPNDYMEIGNHSEFLDHMKRDEMLAMFFVHDGGQTSKWRLKGHSRNTFFSWLSEWAIMLTNPSDIGFDGKGYILPSLNYNEIQIKTEKRDNGLLFNNKSVNATSFNKELRETKNKRIKAAAEIANNSDETFIIWVNQNEEEDLALKMIPDAVAVRGSMKPDKKEELLLGFGRGEFRVLVTKKKIAQFGLNYQNCNNQIFASMDFSFEGLYQAIRRSYRFGQKKEVNIYMITTDTMQNVIASIKRKEEDFRKMQTEMSNLTNTKQTNMKADGDYRDKTEEPNYTLYHGNCITAIKDVKSESVGFSVFSPPFADLYTYSDDPNDLGNSKDYDEFVDHFAYLVPELFRVLKQGRNIAVHCMDLPIQKGKEGFIGLRDFSGMIINAFQDAGFIYHSRITIWKNPVVEMQRTKALGLLHKQVKKDSTMSRVGIPDYVLIFRKDGDRDDPVQNTELSVDLWQKYASPVWMDIDYGNTLNFRSAKEESDEKHICPLQLDTIKRLIHLYTNKGDTVLTPFMGIGSEVYQSVKMGRKGIGIELKRSYYDLAVSNCKEADLEKNQLTLI